MHRSFPGASLPLFYLQVEVKMSQRPTGKVSFSLTNPAVRAWIYQIFAVVLLVACLGYLLHNTITNLTTRALTPAFLLSVC